MPTTNFPNGLTNVQAQTGLGQLVCPDNAKTHQFFDDFNTFTASEWTITRSSTTAWTGSVQDEDGGVLKISNAVPDDANTFIQTPAEIYTFTSGKQTWFDARWKVSDATQSDVVLGLLIRDTSPLDVTDGVYFRKDDGDAFLDFGVEASNTATTKTAVATISSSTYVRTTFYYDGVSAVKAYVNGVYVATAATTNLPTTELCVSFGMQNGSSNAKTFSIDWIAAYKERQSMVDAVTTQTLESGDKNLVMKFTNISDGTGESAVTKVDVSTYTSSTGQVCTGVRIIGIDYDISGMVVRLLWDASTDQIIATLGDGRFSFDWEKFGGIVNNGGSGENGDIAFTTVGHTSGDSYSIILRMVKLYNQYEI